MVDNRYRQVSNMQSGPHNKGGKGMLKNPQYGWSTFRISDLH